MNRSGAMLCLCFAVVAGCSTSRILTQPFKSGENAIVLIVCTGNTHVLIETGRDGYNQAVYTSFYEWIYGSFSTHYSGPGVYLFEPNVINAFVRRNDVVPASGYSRTKGGGSLPTYSKQYHFGFSDADLPGLLAAARDLGATHLIIAELIGHKRQNYHSVRDSETSFPAGHLHAESDNTRIDASVDVSVFSVARQDLLVQRTFLASDDRSVIMSRLVGDHNVRRDIATAILNCIVDEESTLQRRDRR